MTMPGLRKHILRVILMILVAGPAGSCEKSGSPVGEIYTSVDTDYYELEFSVEATDRTGFHIFAEEYVPNDINTDLASAGISNDRIEEVILKEAVLSLAEAGDYTDFDVLRYVELTLYTDSLGEDLIAWSNPVPEDQASLSLDLSENDVLPYFREDNFMLTAQGYLRERVSEDIVLKAKVKFQVKGRL